MHSVLKWGFPVLVAAALVLLAVLVTGNRAPAFPPLPVPNGYDDFVAAGKLVTGDLDVTWEPKLEPLRAFVATNAEAFRLLQLGLSRTSAVPVAIYHTNQGQGVADLLFFKSLAQANFAEGLLAEFEGRTNEAAAIYIRGLRFALESSQGGPLINDLVGISCENIAFRPLTNLTAKIPPMENRDIIAGLEQVDAATISWAEVMKVERLFEAPFYRNPVAWIREWWDTRRALKYGKLKHNRCIVQRRQLLLELALRRYVAEQGKAPQQLGELVPGYLSRLPENPATQQPPDYRAQGTNWVLEFKL